MDLWRWAPVPSGLPNFAGSSTSINALSDLSLLTFNNNKLVRLPVIPLSLMFLLYYNTKPTILNKFLNET